MNRERAAARWVPGGSRHCQTANYLKPERFFKMVQQQPPEIRWQQHLRLLGLNTGRLLVIVTAIRNGVNGYIGHLKPIGSPNGW
jgi:hypothetical protein